MPVEILNSQQRADYGRFNNDLSPEQLTKYCYLTDGDVAFIRKRRPEPYQQLGFALQLMTVRFLGTFLDDPLDVPERLKAFGATRLGIEGEQSLSQYMASKELRFDHRKIICREFGYKTFEDPIEQWSLMRWVYARSWFSTEKPLALFDLATTRLVDRNVLLPGATTLERIVARLYDQASERLYARIVKLLRDVQRDHLLDLLELEPETGLTYLQQLRHGPTHQSGLGVIDALKRLQAFRALGVGEIDLKFLPQSRLRAMAQFAASTKTAELQKLTYNRQIATLFAFGRRYTVRALDDAVDLLWIVLSQIFGQAEREGQQNRLATFAKLDAAALLLADVGQINLDPTVKHTQIRSQIKDQFGFEVIQQAINTVRALARPPGDNHQVEMIEKYNRINLFLPHVLHTLTFEAHTGGQSVQALLVYLKAKLDQLSQDFSSAPLQGVDKQWRKWVLDPDGDAGNNGHAIAYKAYTVWVTHRLQRALKKHDLFLSGSEKWGNVQG